MASDQNILDVLGKTFESWGVSEGHYRSDGEPGKIMNYNYQGKRKGLLIVTTFCTKDIPLLKKRIEWFDHINFSSERDLLLVGDSDVSSEQLQEVADSHQRFFSKVLTRQILDPSPMYWPDNVNHAFRKTFRILTGYYGEPFSWAPYNAWFYFEADMTLLKSNSISLLEEVCIKGKKPFVGFISETKRSDGQVVRHMNGGGVYPTYHKTGDITNYNDALLFANGVPWDVAGLSFLHNVYGLTSAQYIHAFGTTEYHKNDSNITAKQTLNDGTTKEIQFQLHNQFIHHGCKDGSLIDVLMAKPQKAITKINEILEVYEGPTREVTFQKKDDGNLHQLTPEEAEEVKAKTDADPKNLPRRKPDELLSDWHNRVCKHYENWTPKDQEELSEVVKNAKKKDIPYKRILKIFKLTPLRYKDLIK